MRARVLTSYNRRSGSAAGEAGRHVVHSVVATAIVLLVGLTSGVIAARGLGVAGRGQLAAVILWPAVLTALADLGLPTAFTYLSASRVHARFDLARSILPILATQSALLYIAGIPVVLAALGDYPIDVRATAVGFLFAYAPLWLAVRYLGALNLGAGRVFVFNLARVLIPSVYAASLLTILMLGSAGVRVFAIAYAGSWVVGLAAVLAASHKDIRSGVIRPHIDWPTAKLSWSIGYRTYFGSLAPVDTLQLDVLMTTALLGPTEAGLYYVATSAGALVRAWGATLGSLALPLVAAASSKAAALQLLSLFVRITMVASSLIAAILLLFAGPLLALVYGEEFIPAEGLVRILAIGMLAASLRCVLGDGLRGLGQHSPATRAEVVGWLVGGLALIGLLPVWGINGVAIAVSVSYGGTLIAMLVLAKREGVGPKKLLLPAFSDFSSGWSLLHSMLRGRARQGVAEAAKEGPPG